MDERNGIFKIKFLIIFFFPHIASSHTNQNNYEKNSTTTFDVYNTDVIICTRKRLR
jgi:hypothetical protein